MKEEFPNSFNQEVYEEILGMIKSEKALSIEAEKALAFIAGGLDLRSAVDPFDFPSCNIGDNCDECWVQEWCVHKNTPSRSRNKLIEGFQILMEAKLDKRVIKKLSELDKTTADGIAKVAKIVDYYKAKNQIIEDIDDKTEE